MSDDRGLLFCEVGAERYALWSKDVWHIERAEHLQPDASGDGRAGVLKLGEHTTVPVFSLGRRLGRPLERSTPRAEDHIAVTGDSEHLVGWLVDRVIRADQAAPFDISPLPSLAGTPATVWFEGIVRMDEQRAAPLLAPHHLGPGAAAATPRMAMPGPAAMHQAGEPVAVVFSTTALPPTAARRYALSGRQIAAIVQPVPALPLPGCADHVIGITWWHRAVVPVIDFRDAEERSAVTHRRRLIAQCGARHRHAIVAFGIDSEVVMCRPDAANRQLHDVPCPSFASGIFEVNGEAVALLDLDVLLDTEASGLRNGDPVLPDLLVERTAGNAEALSGPLDPPAFGL
jgi:chemotaxis signal transduction protein